MRPQKLPSLARRVARASGAGIVASLPPAIRRAWYDAKRAFSQGAVTDRLSSDWRVSSASGNQETRADIRELRRRARSLFRDDPYVNGLVRDYVQNIVGQTGIECHPKNEIKKGELAEDVNNAIKEAWADWGHAENASTDVSLSWIEQQSQAVESFVIDGEVFIRKHKGFRNDYGYALEIIDPDQLDERMNRNTDRTGNQVIMGIEVDKWYRPLFYHFYERHPSEPGRKNTVPVPADEVIHLFKRKRVGQVRGTSFLAPIIFKLHMLGSYEDAEVTAARIGASKVGFFETDATHLDSFEANKPTEGKLTMDVAPGSMEQLPPGMKFNGWDPQHPSTAYKEFVAAVLRSIAVGGGVAYTTLTGDLTGVNYSSIRAGLLQEREMWKQMQEWFAEKLHRVVFKDWIAMAILTSKVSLPSKIADRWNKVDWKGRGWKWVDPYNDARANEMMIALGLASRTQLSAEMGRDLEDTLKELQREKQLAEKYDVFIDGMAAKLDVPEPIPDAEQSGGTGTPAIPGVALGSGPAKPQAKPKTAREIAQELLDEQRELRILHAVSSGQKPAVVNVAPADVKVDVAPSPTNITLTLPSERKGNRKIMHIHDESGSIVGYELIESETVAATDITPITEVA